MSMKEYLQEIKRLLDMQLGYSDGYLGDYDWAQTYHDDYEPQEAVSEYLEELNEGDF